VTVVDDQGADFPDNTWLRVNGVLANDGTEYRLVADGIEEVAEPDSPYLY
jgi:uncharacterized membrane protein YcgQ (UPF0703/DUF1980 family)